MSSFYDYYAKHQLKCSVCNGSRTETVKWLRFLKQGGTEVTQLKVRCTHCFGTGYEPKEASS